MIKKILGFIIPAILALSAQAQQNSAGGIDGFVYNFGFIIGYNSNTFQVIRTTDFRDVDSLKTVSPISGPGFNLGLLTNLRLSKVMDLRFTPALSFVDRAVSYEYYNVSKNIIKNVESTYIDLPLSVKLKSIRQRNVRLYVIGGLKYSIDVIAQGKVNDAALDEADKKLKIIGANYAYEFGFGFDLYYEYFKFSPEIKISNGLANMILREPNRYSRPIDKLFTRVFQLNFYFE